MPYTGDKLATLFRPEPTLLTARRLAEKGADALLELVVEHTPVDSGNLRGSWKKKLLVIRPSARGATVYETGVFTEVDYAPFVEHGTGLWGPKHAKYLIVPTKPGGVLHWIGHSGEDVFATHVWHPGSPGAHMVAESVGKLELTLNAALERELRRWIREQEAFRHA